MSSIFVLMASVVLAASDASGDVERTVTIEFKDGTPSRSGYVLSDDGGYIRFQADLPNGQRGRTETISKSKVLKWEYELVHHRRERLKAQEKEYETELAKRGLVEINGTQVYIAEAEYAKQARDMALKVDEQDVLEATPEATTPNPDAAEDVANPAPGLVAQWGPHTLAVLAGLALLAVVVKTLILNG